MNSTILAVIEPKFIEPIGQVTENLADLEALGFVTRIRRISTPLGFTTRQITNAYRVHEPARVLGLIDLVFLSWLW